MRCSGEGGRGPRWVWMHRSRGKLLAVHPPLRLALYQVFVRKLGFQRELIPAPTPQG